MIPAPKGTIALFLDKEHHHTAFITPVIAFDQEGYPLVYSEGAGKLWVAHDLAVKENTDVIIFPAKEKRANVNRVGEYDESRVLDKSLIKCILLDRIDACETCQNDPKNAGHTGSKNG